MSDQSSKPEQNAAAQTEFALGSLAHSAPHYDGMKSRYFTRADPVDAPDTVAIDFDIEEVRKQAIQAAETAHACEIAVLKDAHESALAAQAAATKEALEREFTDRLAKALRRSEEKAEAKVAAAEKKVEKAQKSADRARAKAEKEFEDKLSRVQRQHDSATTAAAIAATTAIDKAEAQAAAAEARAEEAETRANSTRAEVEKLFEDKLSRWRQQQNAAATAAATAVDKAEATAAAAEVRAQEAETSAERARAIAEQKLEDELSSLRQQYAAVANIEVECKKVTETAETPARASDTQNARSSLSKRAANKDNSLGQALKRYTPWFGRSGEESQQQEGATDASTEIMPLTENHEVQFDLARDLVKRGETEEARRLLSELEVTGRKFAKRSEAEQLLRRLV